MKLWTSNFASSCWICSCSRIVTFKCWSAYYWRRDAWKFFSGFVIRWRTTKTQSEMTWTIWYGLVHWGCSFERLSDQMQQPKNLLCLNWFFFDAYRLHASLHHVI
jgi:hypothetical protein